MDSLDLAVLRQARDWRVEGHGVWLVTVIETWGSAPRPPGALLAMRDDGLVVGSVSGGCVEDDLIDRVRHGERVGKPSLVAYGVTKEEAARFGLPCGGSLRLVLGTRHQEALRDGDTLDLPLPPQATPRQIQDRAEAWLRDEAKCQLQQIIGQKSALAGRNAPRLTLSFAARGNWVEVQDGHTLRCNWRLIEQPLPVIEQAIARAIAALPPEDRGLDLFGTAFGAPAN